MLTVASLKSSQKTPNEKRVLHMQQTSKRVQTKNINTEQSPLKQIYPANTHKIIKPNKIAHQRLVGFVKEGLLCKHSPLYNARFVQHAMGRTKGIPKMNNPQENTKNQTEAKQTLKRAHQHLSNYVKEDLICKHSPLYNTRFCSTYNEHNQKNTKTNNP